MKRVRSILGFLTCIVLLIISLTATTLCVRSFWTEDVYLKRFASDSPRLHRVLKSHSDSDSDDGLFIRDKMIGISKGGIRFTYRRRDWHVLNGRWFRSHGWEPDDWSTDRGHYPYYNGMYYVPDTRFNELRGLGFQVVWPAGPDANGDLDDEKPYSLTLPLPLIALLTAISPWRRARRWLKKRRGAKLGLCPGCGYDLRATPDRCPECGRAVPTPAGAPDAR